MPDKLQVFAGFIYNNFAMTKTAVDTLGVDVFEPVSDLSKVDCSRICVFPMPTHYLWNLRPSDGKIGYVFELMNEGAWQYLKGDNMYLCFDAAGEGFPVDDLVLENIDEQLGKFGIPAHRAIYLTSDLRAPERYREWCRHRNKRIAFTPFPFDVQLYYFAGAVRGSRQEFEKLYYESNPWLGPRNEREKKFLCLNYTPRPTRIAVSLSLIEEGLEKEGLLSFRGRAVDNGPLDSPAWANDDIVTEWMRRLGLGDQTIAQLPTLDAMSPIVLDEGIDRVTMAYGPTESLYYMRSYFSIVTETMFESQPCEFRLTEKTWKPIAYCHPFVLVSNAGSLKVIRERGFKTFHPFIDESYDLIDDPAVRFRAVQKEIKRLCRLPLSSLHKLYEQLWPAISHNFLLFHFGCGEMLKHEKLFSLALTVPEEE